MKFLLALLLLLIHSLSWGLDKNELKEELKYWKSLLDDELITQEDYNSKKNELLNIQTSSKKTKVSEIPSILFEVKDFYKNEIIEQENLGDFYVINFFASWCKPCLIEHPLLIELQSKGIKIIGVNFRDDEDNFVNWINEHGNPFENVIRDDGTIAYEMGLIGVPETLFIKESTIHKKVQGPLSFEDIEEYLLSSTDTEIKITKNAEMSESITPTKKDYGTVGLTENTALCKVSHASICPYIDWIELLDENEILEVLDLDDNGDGPIVSIRVKSEKFGEGHISIERIKSNNNLIKLIEQTNYKIALDKKNYLIENNDAAVITGAYVCKIPHTDAYNYSSCDRENDVTWLSQGDYVKILDDKVYNNNSLKVEYDNRGYNKYIGYIKISSLDIYNEREFINEYKVSNESESTTTVSNNNSNENDKEISNLNNEIQKLKNALSKTSKKNCKKESAGMQYYKDKQCKTLKCKNDQIANLRAELNNCGGYGKSDEDIFYEAIGGAIMSIFD